MKKVKSDWVFWIQITRRHWFKLFWINRGANFLEIQCFGLQISIGMPWRPEFEAHMSTTYCQEANKENLKFKYSFLVKR